MSDYEHHQQFVTELLAIWKLSNKPFKNQLWDTIVTAMQFVSELPWDGSAKKEEVLSLVAEVLKQTDGPGPDFVVDKFLYWTVDSAIDYLYDAHKGKFKFG